MAEAVIFMANGTEECETLITVDVFRRAGIPIEIVSIEDDKTVMTAHSVPVVCEKTLDEFSLGEEKFLIIPGGLKGVERMVACERLGELIKAHHKAGKPLAAICAGPTVLGSLGLLEGHKATCFPGCEDGLGENVDYQGDAYALADREIVTGRGVGATFEFALKLLEILRGKESSDELRRKLQYPC